MNRGPSRWLVALALLAAPGALAAPAGAADAEVENLRVGFGERNQFKLGAWTPVRVQVRGGGTERFRGLMEVSVPDDEGIPTRVRQRVDVGPGQVQGYVAYARPGGRGADFEVRFYDESGRRVGRDAVLASNRLAFDALLPGEELILALGNPQGVEQVSSLPGYGRGTQDRGLSYVVARLDALDDQLPGRWVGYDAVRAVVLDANDRGLMDALAGGKAEALKQWVARGGHLVVAGAAQWQRLADSPLAEALPAVPAGQVRIQSLDLRALESFASSNVPIPGEQPVMVAKLDRVEARRGKVLSAVAGVPLVVRGPFGFGRVTLIGVDVDQNPFASWEDRDLFWSKALDLPRAVEAPGGGPAARLAGGQIFVSGVNDLSSALRRGLERFEGIKLIPFGWVAFFIFLYILLIGPGDYLFLKKVLKRMELTWVTFPAIVLTVSLAAYYVAYEVKGTELRVNKVDALDVDQVANLSRGRSWANVFSPQNRDYDVAFRPLDLQAEPPAPAPGFEAITTWFGVAEAGFGGMGGGTQVGFSHGGYDYRPDGSAESLGGVRIPIWSTKCFAGQWFGPGTVVVESALEPAGTDRLNGTVTNRFGRPLKDALLAFNNQVYTLGTIAPGATVRVELTPSRTLVGYLRSLNQKTGRGPSDYYGPRVDLGELTQTLMFHAVLGEELPVGNQVLGDLDLTGQLALDRPMLMARVDGPVAALELGGGGEPRIEQTTVVRAILPLEAPADAGGR